MKKEGCKQSTPSETLENLPLIILNKSNDIQQDKYILMHIYVYMLEVMPFAKYINKSNIHIVNQKFSLTCSLKIKL
jgi:hypothetical protein